MRLRKSKQKRKSLLLQAIALSILFFSNQHAFAVETIKDAKVLKLHVYKSARTMVELDKTPELPLSDNCTHSNKRYFSLVLADDNTSAVEEIYAALLTARMTDTPVTVLTSGCVSFGGATIPNIILVTL